MPRWTRVAFLAAGGLLLILLILRVDWSAVAGIVASSHPPALLAAAGLVAANVAVKGLRWRMLARRLTGEERQLSIGSAIRAVCAGVAAASVTPGRAFDLAKPLLLRRSHGTPLAAGVGAAMVERLFDGIALVVLFGISLSIYPLSRDREFRPVLIAAVVLLAGGLVVLIAPRGIHLVGRLALRLLSWMPGLQSMVERAGREFIEGVVSSRGLSTLPALAAYSIGAGILEAGRLAAVAGAVGVSLSVGSAMLVFSAANLVAVAALIPGGIGVTELTMGAATALVTGLRAGGPAAAAIVALDRLLSYYLIVGVGAMVLLTSARGEEVLPDT
jgi:uncharacterized protein (TIRG00374 family)